MILGVLLKDLRSSLLACCALLFVTLGASPVFAEHRDPAPISADVVRQLTKDRHQPDNPLAAHLGRHLDEAAAILQEVEETDKKADSASSIASKRMLMEGKLNELATMRDEVRRHFAETRARMMSLGLEDKAKEWDDLLAGVEKRFDRVIKALDAVHKAPDKAQRGKALDKAKQALYDLHGKRKEAESAPQGPIPTWTQDTRPFEEPSHEKAPAPEYISSQPSPANNVYAFLGDTLLAAADPTPTEAQSCNYTAADLAESQEVALTQEIRDLAAKLGYSPARIYEYVSNNIKFEPYYGSLKGASGTLVAGGGNATDHASLLIALLRASNIPARYVKGTVQFTNDPRVLRWTGTKDYVASAYVLSQGAIPVGFDSPSKNVWFSHVWVEACVPYAHYRGAKLDNAGHRWIPLDASFKDKSYQAGIATNVSFDYTGYLAARSNTLPHEAYEQQVESYIKGVAPNYGNNTLEDVPYKGNIIPRKVDILPASLPYWVTSFTAWGSGIATADTAEVPDAHRNKFTVTVKNSGGTQLATTTRSLPQTALSRTTLTFKGATSADQTALDSWRNDGNLDSAIPTTINVVPVIKVDGADQAVGTGSVGLGTTNNQLTLSVTLAELSSPTLNSVTYTNIGAANYHALQAYAFQTSDRLLNERAARLLNTVKNTANPNSNPEETEGEFLHLVGLKYMRYMANGFKRVAELDGGSGESGNHLGLTCARMKVQYLFDLPFAVNRSGYLVDVPGGLSRSVDLTTGKPVWKTFLLGGYASSAYESYIWQENAHLDAVSTVRGIQFAKETGIEVLTLASANWSVAGDTACANTSSQCYKFTHNSNSALNYSTAQVSSIKSNFIDQGYTVTIPRSLIQYGDWKGAVYVAEKNNIAVDGTARASYIINQYAGGYTVNASIDYTFNSTLNTGFYQAPSTPTSTYSSSVPQYTVGSGNISNGFTTYNTFNGDPVNMVTGNMYHTERDIAIKGRGGLPIVFERSYNSRMAQDGPLGYGWTHSFNHYLKFYGVENSVAKVGWTDGTGSEKFFSATPDAGNGVPVNTTFTNPAGIFVQFKRLADGTYTIREKNGLTYTFESVAGTANQKARLLKIADRNGNTLTLNYTSGNLTSVVDGLSRSLTFTYTGSRITQVGDWSGRSHQYVYDANGNLTQYKNPLAGAAAQNPVFYEYYTSSDGTNLNHAMKKYTLPRGNGMTFEYYANGRAFKHYNTLGETNTFTYNDFRRETVTVNERGFTRRFFFDKYGNPVKIVEENGGEREYTYDTANPYNRLSKADPMGYQTQYAYDANGNVTQITNPSGGTVMYSYFNAFNQPGKLKDARGNYSILKYDAKGNLLQEIRLKSGIGATVDPAAYTPATSDIVAWTINTYDVGGNLLTTKKVRDFATQSGPTVEYTYDAQGLNPTAVTKRGDKNGDGVIAAGEYDTANLTYDSLGRLTAGIDGDWQATQFTYDSVDRVIRGTDATGNQRDYYYDANGNPVGQKLTLPVSGTPTLVDSGSASYDLSDRKEKSTDAGGFVTAYQYDAAGNVVKVTNPDNYTLGFEYDENNHVIKAYDQENNAVTRTLDLDGKTRTVTDPNGNTVKYEYYASERDGRLKKTTDAANRATTFDYDNNGNAITVTDALGRVTTTTYDELNRPVRIVGPSYTDATYGIIRPVTKYTYDNLGNLIAVAAGRTDSSGTNPASDVTTTQMTYAYDDFGRKLKETDALGKFWSFEYDVNNNVTKVTDAKNQVTTYTWGYGHQLLTRTSTAGTLTYTRNALGQALTAQSPEVTYTYTYDANHRPTSAKDSRGNKTLSYNYSPGGMLNYMTDSDNNRTDYLYDAVGRLVGIFAPNYEYVTFRYDAGGRLSEKWFPNGVNTRYSYNADNTLQQVVNRTSTSSVISQHDYTYDGMGNRQTLTEKVGSTTTPYYYAYDELNRLKEVRNTNASGALIEGYSYDALNNRLSKTDGVNPVYYVYDAANQLKEVRQGSTTGTLLASMLYDDNGNMNSKTEGSTTTTMVYDALNRLSQVSKTGQSTQSYQYDDQGRRISKAVGSTTTSFLYNGPDIVAEYTSWTAPNAQYTHGPNMDDPIIRQAGSTSQYYHQDGLGSVVGLSNSADTTTATQRFDAWGNRIASTGTIPQYGYTGREPDETGLVYYRARYYDPSIGRFTQRDSIGLAGGLNQFAYVGGNPVNFTDPMGLQAFNNSNTNNVTQSASYYGGSTYQSGAGTLGMNAGQQNMASNQFARENDILFNTGLRNIPNFDVNQHPLVRESTPSANIILASWQYSQSTGQMTHVDDKTGASTSVGTGYAGHNQGLNNPEYQNVPGGGPNSNAGPLPQGAYTIGPQQDNVTGSGTKLPGSMRLFPDSSNKMFNRGGFLIHGDNGRGDQSASQGCIILNRDIRNRIGDSGDNVLKVVP